MNSNLTMAQLKEVMVDRQIDLDNHFEKRAITGECDRDEFHRKNDAKNEAYIEYYDVYKTTEEWKQELKTMRYFNQFINNRGNFKNAMKICKKYDL